MIGCHYGAVNASGMNGLDLCKIADALIDFPDYNPEVGQCPPFCLA